MNASVLYIINEVELSMYRFLTSGAKKGYWMRESVFNSPRPDRTRATGRPVPWLVEPIGQCLDRFSLLAPKTYLFQFFSFLTLRQSLWVN